MRRVNRMTMPPTSEAERDRPGLHVRLLPPSLSRTVSPSHPISGDGRSIDYTRHTSMRGLPRVCAPFTAHSSPATGQGLRPDNLGPPEAITPRLYSPVASLGIPLSHGDGTEDTPDPHRTVESVWGTHPTLDFPVVPTGEPRPTSNGRESALPSLRMVERFPHKDRPQRELPIALSHSGSGAGRPTGPSALVTALPSPTPPPTHLYRHSVPRRVPLVGTLPGVGPLTLSPVEGCQRGARPTPRRSVKSSRETHLCRRSCAGRACPCEGRGTSTHSHPSNPHHAQSHTQPSPPLRHPRAVGLEVRQGVNPSPAQGWGCLTPRPQKFSPNPKTIKPVPEIPKQSKTPPPTTE